MNDSTLPLDYESALIEIERLKGKLEVTQEKWAKVVVSRILDNRSHSALTLAQKELQEAVKELCDSGYDGPFMGERVQRLFRARWALPEKE